jgi:hypothetical protein
MLALGCMRGFNRTDDCSDNRSDGGAAAERSRPSRNYEMIEAVRCGRKDWIVRFGKSRQNRTGGNALSCFGFRLSRCRQRA